MTPLDDLREIKLRRPHRGEVGHVFCGPGREAIPLSPVASLFLTSRRRVAAVTDQIVSDNPGATVVITAHGWLNKIFLMNAFGIGLGSFWQMPSAAVHSPGRHRVRPGVQSQRTLAFSPRYCPGGDDILRTTVTILCENTAVTSGKLLGEHGLSFLVERGRDRLLFDTGQGQTLARNAATLGKDLSTVQRVLLSHGHYDHSGGLGGVLTERGLNTVYGLPGLFRDRYALHETSEGIRTRFIGMSLSQEQIESHGAAVDLSEKFREVLPGMYASGRVERPKGWQGLDARLVVPSPSGFDPDPFDDDCSLLLETDAGPVLLLGCAHAGLPAILPTRDRFRQASTVCTPSSAAPISGPGEKRSGRKRSNSSKGTRYRRSSPTTARVFMQ